MAQVVYSPDTVLKVPGAKAAIIQSKWHTELSDRMVEKCIQVLRLAEFEEPSHHQLPGVHELPLAARTLRRNDPALEVIIAFGIIIKGDTFHFEMVLDQCMRGFSTVSLEDDIPIINEVLPVQNRAQAEVRCADDESNKGFEAGLAAADIVAWRRGLRGA